MRNNDYEVVSQIRSGRILEYESIQQNELVMKFIVDLWVDQEFESEEVEEKWLKEFIFDSLDFAGGSVDVERMKDEK